MSFHAPIVRATVMTLFPEMFPGPLGISLAGRAGEPVAVLVDARRNEAYFQRFERPGIAAEPARLLSMAEALEATPGIALLARSWPDIADLARFAATADPSLHPPEASYIRDADAKPQDRARIARVSGS